MRIEGILARNSDHAIGQYEGMPWTHSGDLKRFKSITTGHALLMGAKTFLGIAKNHFSSKPGIQVLPARQIFVLGNPRAQLVDMYDEGYAHVHRRGYGKEWIQLVHEILSDCREIGIDKSNFRVVVDDDPEDVLKRIEDNYNMEGKTLFIAGGARVYKKYLGYASVIHETIIGSDARGDGIVYLDSETIDLLGAGEIEVVGEETSDGVKATYRTITK